MIRLGILGSTRGSLILPLQEAIVQRKLAASIEMIVSNKPEAGILKKANDLGLEGFYVELGGLSREVYDRQLSDLFEQHRVELILLLGYLRILSKAFVDSWSHRIINTHPSLLPDFAGLMDRQVHQAVLDAGVSQTGCTVHFVTDCVDAGPILVQEKCPVLSSDTVDSLKERVQRLEGQALIKAIQQFSTGREVFKLKENY